MKVRRTYISSSQEYTAFISQDDSLYIFGTPTNNARNLELTKMTTKIKPISLVTVRKGICCLDYNNKVYFITFVKKSEEKMLEMCINEMVFFRNKHVVKLAGSISWFVLTNKNLYGFGINAHGRLGNGNWETRWDSNSKAQFNNDEVVKVVDISSGYDMSFVITKKGKVFGCGANYSYQNGLLEESDKFTEIRCLHDKGIKKIECGFGHTLFLSRDGKVYVCGWNSGRLGLGHTANVSPPVHNNLLPEDIIGIGCSWYSSYFISRTKLYGSGKCSMLELPGISITEESILSPRELNVKQRIIHICGGWKYTVFVDEGGYIYTCGANGYKQCGRPEKGKCKYGILSETVRVKVEVNKNVELFRKRLWKSSWNLFFVDVGIK